jgi:hypothetical protein
LDYTKRLSEESEFDYIIRLVEGKINNIYDIDYVELFKLGFGVEFSSDHCRKMFYSLKMLLPYIDKTKITNITSDSIISELDIKKIEIEKEKMKLYDQRREFKKLIRQEARLENIKDFIKEVAEDIKLSKPLIELESISYKTSDKEGVLLLSDFHSEMNIDNFLNKFNKEEFIRRFNRLVDKTIEHGITHKINTLHVANLNDLISGIIHITVRLATNEDVITQTMFISELLAEMLIKFSKYFNNVKFYSVLDNHSRVNANLKESKQKESFARFITWYLETRLSNINNVEIVNNNIDEDICIFEVCGKVCGMVHGHKDSISNVVQNISLMTKTFLDYMFLSHYHHNIEDEIHSCEVIVNPSLIGVDEFSKDKRWSSKPAQKFMIFNKEEGRECSYNIRLDV